MKLIPEFIEILKNSAEKEKDPAQKLHKSLDFA
jgi:hypothetical protein